MMLFIIDVQVSDETEIGINWDILSDTNYDIGYRQNFTTRLGSTVANGATIGNATAFNTTGVGGDFSVISGTIRNVVSMLQQKRNVEIIASPRAMMVSGQSASIKAVEEIPYSEVSDTAAGGVGALTSTRFKEVGVTLEVSGTIIDGNNIFMTVDTEQNVKTGESATGVPLVDTRQAVTSLLLKDGQIDQIVFKRSVEEAKLPYDYAIAGSVSQALSILGREKFDAIVSDYWLGDGTALDILNAVKDTPVVLTTRAADERVAVEAWKAGAYDYLPKDYEKDYLKNLPKAIENAIRHMATERLLDRKQKDLEAVFDAAPVSMLLADANMTVVRANRTMSRMLQKGFSRIIGRSVGDALGCTRMNRDEEGCGAGQACDECLLRSAMKKVFDSGQAVHEVEIHPKLKIKGREIEFWLHISVEPIDVGGSAHVLTAIHDVTERRPGDCSWLKRRREVRFILQKAVA